MRKRARSATPTEMEFMRRLMLALGTHPSLRLWRQNCGQVPIRDAHGNVVRMFDAGPPNGAADLSGIVRPEGFRLEIECKSAGGERSLEQRRWADFIVGYGGVYVLAQYNPMLSLEDNVAAAVRDVENALAQRRRRAA